MIDFILRVTGSLSKERHSEDLFGGHCGTGWRRTRPESELNWIHSLCLTSSSHRRERRL